MDEETMLIDAEQSESESESAPKQFKPRPMGNWLMIIPYKVGEVKSPGGIIRPGIEAKRQKEMAAAHYLNEMFKQNHAIVLEVGPDVQRVRKGDVVRFVAHPQTVHSGEPLQECVINGETVDFIPETLVYAVLEPIDAPEPTVLQ